LDEAVNLLCFAMHIAVKKQRGFLHCVPTAGGERGGCKYTGHYADEGEQSMDEKDLEKATQTIRGILEKEIREKYSDAVLRNWLDPQHMGQIERPEGYGKMTGSCGDEMEFFLRVRDEKIIDVRFSTGGCITSIASGNMGAELAHDKTISEALMIEASDILNGLHGLPPEDEHCAQLATDTIKEAIRDYFLNMREPWRRDY
jgi:nitrogen fixation protein NifU and related proteins